LKIFLSVILTAIVGAVCIAQAKTADENYEYQTFYLVFLKTGPHWKTTDTSARMAILRQHLDHVLELGTTGQEVLAGPLENADPLAGVAVYSVDDAKKATELAETDPAVKAGVFSYEIHPWYAAKGIMKMPGGPLKLDTYYLGLLVKGASWTAAKSPELDQLQEAHLANIRRLHGLRKLVIAGPIGGEDDLRGIFVFKTQNLDEARALAETDPAVKAGRLAIKLYTWRVPAGALP
jgi:uncharacterized protein YciI